ncbi:hypothetical protein, partial [Aquabacterium sp.]|uniref:hypothetical protein n=1 Tax=Aquabacterium sp. TaxID=1872578 RepID=UPI0025B9A647
FTLAAANQALALCAAAAWPWLVLLLGASSRGQLTLAPRPGRALRGNLLYAMSVPSVVMVVGVVSETNVYDLSHWRLVIAGAIFGGLWCKLAMAASPREDNEAEGMRWLTGLLAAIPACLIGVLALFGLNRKLDYAPATPYFAEVLQKRAIYGKGASYNLKIGPWGPQKLRDSYAVSQWLYDHLEVGDSAQIQMHSGWLGQPWIEISAPMK